MPCRRVNIKHDDPSYLELLVCYNTQRVKNRAEQLRETLVKTDPYEAYQKLIDYRKKQAEVKVETISVGTRGQRKKITKVKFPMVERIKEVVMFERRKSWPLCVRAVHYALLNKPLLRNTKKKTRYCNNLDSYNDTCNLLVRLRLSDEIPMNAIEDETRPTTEWNVHSNPQDFAREELNNFLKGYRRNLQQTQPLHIEVVAEKLTVKGIIRPVCGKYNIPYTIGRGYSSLPARYEIVQRFKRSGKDRLCLLVLGDFDPEGVNIGESLLQSIREDFGIENAQAVRVGLKPEQIARFNIHDNNVEAKKKSPRYKAFVERYGRKVFELEALSPTQLQTILTEAIDSVIDVEAFNAELEAEKSDAAYLQAVRERIYENVLGLIDENESTQLDTDDDVDF
ncbi:MAG: chromosome partitioning protein ParB [Planctomycetes bacterium]|nr:chromosome partitioning protein ParB [Planctomycetota bacterium]